MHKIFLLVLSLFIINISFSQELEDVNFKLLVASESGNETDVLNLIKEKADVNASNADGVTPLMYASQNGYLDIVKILLFNGAKINTRPNNGINALISATIYDKKDVVEYLLKEGADINAKDNDSISALLYASAYGNFEMVDMLFFYGADIYTNALDGVNPLIVASYFGYENIVDLLLNRGANINITDFYGWTPLMVAIQNNYLNIAEKLLQKNANINSINNFGFSAISIATQYSNKLAIDLLMKYNPNLKIKTKDSLSLSDIAYKSGRRDIAKYFRKKGLKSTILPSFKTWEILPITSSWNFTDIEYGGDILVQDIKYNINIFTGFQTRVLANRITQKLDDQYLIQKWEQRKFLYLGVGRSFKLKTLENKTIELSPFCKFNYTWGKYRAFSERPKSNAYFVPGVYLVSNWKYTTVKIGYEYNYFDVKEFNPNRIIISLGFRIISSSQKVVKTIDWI